MINGYCIRANPYTEFAEH